VGGIAQAVLNIHLKNAFVHSVRVKKLERAEDKEHMMVRFDEENKWRAC
jgi:hypothetical protein